MRVVKKVKVNRGPKVRDRCENEPELTAQLEGIASRLSVIEEELDFVMRHSKCEGRMVECHDSANFVRQALDPITNLVERQRNR